MKEMKLILSKRLREYLSSINHKIADDLLKSHNNGNLLTKKTFIDINPDIDDSLTFIQVNKIINVLGHTILDDEKLLEEVINNNDHKIYSKYRANIKIGKLINYLYGIGTYQQSKATDVTKKQDDIENFVRIFKSLHNKSEKFKLFDIVEGDSIKYWYNSEHYEDDEKGTLGGSCMGNVNKDFFDIYTLNPDKVKLLIYYANEDKTLIIGRALIWFLDKPVGRVFMERIYTNNSSDEQLFLEYANNNKWLHKDKQEYGTGYKIIDTINNTKELYTLQCNIKNNFYYNHFPFLDTLQFYNFNDDLICNKNMECTHRLDSTEGYKNIIEDGEDVYVNSIYHNDYIPQNNSKWCEIGNDWVFNENSVYVYNTGGKYAIINHDSICKCEIDGKKIKYFLKIDCIFSEYLNTWIYKDSIIKVYKDREHTDFVLETIKRNIGKNENVYYKYDNNDGYYYLLNV